MRGTPNRQPSLLALVSVESLIPSNHPLRRVKPLADAALRELDPTFEKMYARIGRPSVPPEQLLKASLLMSLYSVRSERMFCEQLGYNMSQAFADFRGKPRKNDTHASTTDPEALLLKKGRGKEAKLCFLGHVITENRHGLVGRA